MRIDLRFICRKDGEEVGALFAHTESSVRYSKVASHLPLCRCVANIDNNTSVVREPLAVVLLIFFYVLIGIFVSDGGGAPKFP